MHIFHSVFRKTKGGISMKNKYILVCSLVVAFIIVVLIGAKIFGLEWSDTYLGEYVQSFNREPYPLFERYSEGSGALMVVSVTTINDEHYDYTFEDGALIDDFVQGVSETDLEINRFPRHVYMKRCNNKEKGYSIYSIVLNIYDENHVAMGGVEIYDTSIYPSDDGTAWYFQKDFALSKYIIEFCENNQTNDE